MCVFGDGFQTVVFEVVEGKVLGFAGSCHAGFDAGREGGGSVLVSFSLLGGGETLQHSRDHRTYKFRVSKSTRMIKLPSPNSRHNRSNFCPLLNHTFTRSISSAGSSGPLPAVTCAICGCNSAWKSDFILDDTRDLLGNLRWKTS